MKWETIIENHENTDVAKGTDMLERCKVDGGYIYRNINSIVILKGIGEVLTLSSSMVFVPDGETHE